MDDDELRRWQEFDLHLSELAKHPGWQWLHTYIDEYVTSGVDKRVNTPNLKTYSWEKYIADIEYLRGVRDVFSAAQDVHEKVATELRRRADA